MNELIKIKDREIGGEEIQTVNARDLHAFLEVKSEFRNWIKNRIEDFGFVENQDFVTAGKNLPSGKTQIDYHISIDMAKELSMVERNEKGREARKYFIACEKVAKSRLESMRISRQQSRPCSWLERLSPEFLESSRRWPWPRRLKPSKM
ncbi:MAG: hypothetical protein ABS69_00925 [Nitrosomonadales bacterium SCN 54-20]|nr:MAG: hypothetical protein ABS69_00925 [Nitrosomonadales bacterium SCN 54-20]